MTLSATLTFAVYLSSLILLDLNAAFDTVDHQLLLAVLAKRFSVDSTALSWFQSYLTNRTQTFTYNGGETSSFGCWLLVPNFPTELTRLRCSIRCACQFRSAEREPQAGSALANPSPMNVCTV